MACRWRIRHKLLLGLGLVVVLVALLLAGALKGLISYRTTTRTIDAKLIELKHAFELQAEVKQLPKKPDSLQKELIELKEKVGKARAALGNYEAILKEFGRYGTAPDKSHTETEIVLDLWKRFEALDKAIKDAQEQGRASDASLPFVEQQEVKPVIDYIIAGVDDLISCTYDSSYKRINKAKRDSKFSLAVVLSTSVLGVLLMAGLLRFFYRLVFYPIRDLQAGVGRVGQGDFEHTIALHSGDEIEDLANAFNDMTGRLREMYRDLARQVNERSRQLVRSERLAGVGFLAAGVAHEINNPLASIAFCSEALERRLSDVLAAACGRDADGPDAQVITKYLRMIQQEAFRCKEITQRLLEFSRGGERRFEPADLAELIQGVLDVAQHLQNCRGKHILFEPSGRLVAWVNAQEIKSVVLNLVVNALDSMDEGGTLSITLSQRDGMAQMVFTDTGCGMTQEVLENIFEPFFTRSRTGKGTGLGLSISHRIINQHRGEIEAVSAGPNRGSTFTVRLPLHPPADEGRESAAPEREQEPPDPYAAPQRRAA